MTKAYDYSDRIEKYKILETYIKLDIDYDSNIKKSIIRTLQNVADKQVKEFKYNDSLVVVIEIEKGSIKAKVIIYGTIIVQGIANYGSIRQGLSQIYDDVRWVSEQVITNATQENNDIRDNIIRTEKRTGLIGRLKRTLDRIDYLQNNLNNLGNNQVQNELNLLKQDLANILELLNAQEHQAIFNSLPQHIKDTLPQPKNEEMKHLYNLYALKPEDIEIVNN